MHECNLDPLPIAERQQDLTHSISSPRFFAAYSCIAMGVLWTHHIHINLTFFIPAPRETSFQRVPPNEEK